MLVKRLSLILTRAGFLLALVFPVIGSISTAAERPSGRQGLSAHEVARIPAEDLKLLEFHAPGNLRGELRVRSDIEVGQVLIEFSKDVYNLTAGEQSERILTAITYETEITNDRLMLVIRTPKDAEWEGTQIGVSAICELVVPAGLSINCESDAFDFDLSGPFREVSVAGKFGNIRVEEVSEKTDLRSDFGDITLRNAVNRVSITNRYGASYLASISTGDNPLHVRSDRGKLDIQGMVGPMDVAVDGAPISIQGWAPAAGQSRISAEGSPITIGIESWQAPTVTIKDRNGDVEITTPAGFSAILRLAISRDGLGFIRTRGLPVKVTRLDHYTLEGVAGDGGGLLEVNVDGTGQIKVIGSHPRAGGEGGEAP